MSVSGIKITKAFVVIEVLDKTAAMLRQVSARMNAFAANLFSTGSQLALGAGALLTPAWLGLQKFMSFEDAMLRVKAVTEGTEEEFQRLGKAAQNMATYSGFTATEIANVMTEIGKAGFSRRQVEEMTGSLLDLARASGEDLVNSAEIAMKVLRQFNMEAADTVKVSDLLVGTANETILKVSDLGESLKYTAVYAHQFGLTLEETFAVLGVLGDLGVSGELAGTAMRNMFIQIATNRSSIENLGIDVENAGGKFNKLIHIMGQLQEKTKDYTDTQRAAFFHELFNIRGMLGASNVASHGVEIEILLNKLQDINGIARETASTMQSGFGGVFRALMAGIDNIAISFGKALGTELKVFTALSQGAADSIIQWITANKELVITLTKVVIGVLAFGLALMALSAALRMITLLFTLLFSKLGLILVAVALLSGLPAVIDDIGNSIASASADIEDAFENMSMADAMEYQALRSKIAWLESLQSIREAYQGLSDWVTNDNNSLFDDFVEDMHQMVNDVGSTFGLIEDVGNIDMDETRDVMEQERLAAQAPLNNARRELAELEERIKNRKKEETKAATPGMASNESFRATAVPRGLIDLIEAGTEAASKAYAKDRGLSLLEQIKDGTGRVETVLRDIRRNTDRPADDTVPV